MNWKVEGRGDTFAVIDESDNEIATVPYEPLRGVDAADSAEYRRACLISSAPELLEALEAVNTWWFDGSTDTNVQIPQHLETLIKAAIDKARVIKVV